MEPESEQPDFDRAMYLEILREDLPMKRYVSRGDMRDSVDIQGPHEDVDRVINRALGFVMKDRTPRFQPVLGPAGMGKTHLFWTLKDREDEFTKGKYLTVYVPSPPAPVRVPLHFHACIVDEVGEVLFENAVDMLITKLGGLRGATHETYDYNYALDRILIEYPGISADVVKVLLRYRLDPANRDLSRRWLLGDALNHDEIEKLDVRTILEEDDVTMATLNLLMEGSETPMVLFFDELEGPFNTHGEEGERHFLEVIKRLYNEGQNIMIVASCLTEIWDRVYGIADGPMRSRMENPVHLRNFTRDDIKEFIAISMNQYWSEQNIEPPPDPIFPVRDSDIDEAFDHSQGNPRDAIKFLIPRIEEIIFGEAAKPVEEQADYVIKLTASVVISAISSALTIVGKRMGVEVELVIAEGGSKKQATAILKLTKGESVQKICIDVANVKDWDRSGGVAAFYSVKRLKSMLDEGLAELAIVAIPEGTGGAKFTSLGDELGEKLVILRFNIESGTALVEAITKGLLKSEQEDAFMGVVQKAFPE